MTARLQALVASLVALVLILTAALFWSLNRPQLAETPPPPPISSSVAPTFNPSAGDAGGGEQPHDDGAHDREADQAAWQPVVEHFARNFTKTAGGSRKWRGRLTGDRTPPYVTDAVAKQLLTVDVRNVPKGRYSRFEIVRTSAYDISVKVNYREGWSMVLHLITDGTDWQVYSYDRWQQ